MSSTDLQKTCDCAEDHHDIIKFLTDVVDQAVYFKDNYFETHSLDDAINRNRDIEALLTKDLQIFKKHENLALQENKPYYYYLKGKLINLGAEYSEEAENLLSKAIKLDAKLVNAWNELGECYCKKPEFPKAKSCFEGAMKEQRNKVSLRSLSIIYRQSTFSNSQKEIIKNLETSIAYAKEAVQLDPQDGLSWETLGNTYVAYFFMVHQKPILLKQSLSAYTQAEKYIVSRSSPHLHYNKAINFKYQEYFKLALESFHEACRYNPLWEVPRQKENELVMYLKNIQELVNKKGKLKPKKLQQIVGSIDVKQLGLYGGEGFVNSVGEKITLKETPYDNLTPGPNENTVILGKVICSIRTEDNVPFTFCSIDKAGSVIVTSVYNLASGKGVIIGDSVAIPEPFLNEVDFVYNGDTFKFKLVRVDMPVILVVNSKKLGCNMQAGVEISIANKFD
ncbi:hypothetical protein ABEB36_006037 [Hypothenemus hampei]|uniref:Tetratricopeptide repeat protein 5 OB fold domain-containing protein n=1 Tax=Hypothenemus hampei TaxID=57062 RepID=A0ABD1F097_HYPHA